MVDHAFCDPDGRGRCHHLTGVGHFLGAIPSKCWLTAAEHPEPAAPDEGAASPRRRSEVDDALDTLRTLRMQLQRGDYRSEQDRLYVMVDLCEAFDELDQAMTLGAALPAAWREACTIRTVDQLDALPVDSVIRTAAGEVLTRGAGGWTPGDHVVWPQPSWFDAWLLWHPDWSK